MKSHNKTKNEQTDNNKINFYDLRGKGLSIKELRKEKIFFLLKIVESFFKEIYTFNFC